MGNAKSGRTAEIREDSPEGQKILRRLSSLRRRDPRSKQADCVSQAALGQAQQPKPPPTPPPREQERSPRSSSSTHRIEAEVEAIRSLGLALEEKALAGVASELVASKQASRHHPERNDSKMEEVAAAAAREEDRWGAAHGLDDMLLRLRSLEEEAGERQPSRNQQIARGSEESSPGRPIGSWQRPPSHQQGHWEPPQVVELLKPGPPPPPPQKETKSKAPSEEASGGRAGVWYARPLADTLPSTTVLNASAKAPSVRFCPFGHVLIKFYSQKDTLLCQSCRGEMREGTPMHGCHACKFNICGGCALKADAAALHARSAAKPPSALSVSRSAARMNQREHSNRATAGLYTTQLKHNTSYPSHATSNATTTSMRVPQAAGTMYPNLNANATKSSRSHAAAAIEQRYTSGGAAAAEGLSSPETRAALARRVLHDLEERGGQQLSPQQCRDMLSHWAGTSNGDKPHLTASAGGLELGHAGKTGSSFLNSSRQLTSTAKFMATGGPVSSNVGGDSAMRRAGAGAPRNARSLTRAGAAMASLAGLACIVSSSSTPRVAAFVAAGPSGMERSSAKQLEVQVARGTLDFQAMKKMRSKSRWKRSLRRA